MKPPPLKRFKTRLLCLAGALAMLLVLNYFGAFDPSDEELRQRFQSEIPPGSSRAQVEGWLKASNFDYSAVVDGHLAERRSSFKRADSYVATLRFDFNGACRNDRVLILNFRGQTLTDFEIDNHSTCF